MAITIDACFAQHQGDRDEQQDRVAIVAHPKVRGVALAVVADGMGGHAGGALAAEQVVHTARNNLAHFSPTEDTPRHMLENSLEEAHTMIKMSRFMNEKDPHSTAVALLLEPGRISWSHCGDSRLYWFRGDKPHFRTTDHSYVEHLISIGKITPEEAQTHPYRNVLLTSLGGSEPPKFDYAETSDVVGGDSYLLCSDGLWSYFEAAEMAGVVAAFPAREACEVLLKRARERAHGQGDNVSLAIIKLKEVEAPKARPMPRPPR
jgi:serine/threonine protein phosphatase PrpC